MIIFKIANWAIKYVYERIRYASELESKCNGQEMLWNKIYTYICVKKRSKLNPNVEISTVDPISLLFSHHIKVWKLAHSLVSESRAEYYEFSFKTMYFTSSESILESLPEPDNVIDSSLIVKNISIVEERVWYKYYGIIMFELYDIWIMNIEENVECVVGDNEIDKKMSCCWESS